LLGEHAYGKSGVRLVQVTRSADRDTLRDFTIAVAFQGDYAASYVQGSNSDVLPTDTMKNTVYALAAREQHLAPEPFAMTLGNHFLAHNAQLACATIDVQQHLWEPMTVNGREHGQAFLRRGPDTRTARVVARRERIEVTAGIADLVIMKTGHSAFSGFKRDEFTTLAETRDRLLATSMTATWHYATPSAAFEPAWHAVRHALLETFARHESESVQHTLYAMGEAVLDAAPDVTDIHIVMPNRHHIAVDVRPFRKEQETAESARVFVATTEPFGLIEGTIRRR